MADKAERLEFVLENGETIVGDYLDSDAKQGIVLVPGFTEHRSSFQETADQLSEDFKVLSIDINGQGESTGHFSLNDIADSLYLLQRKLKKSYGWEKLGAHENSIGAMAVGLVAAETENLVDAISLSSAPAGLQDIIPQYQNKILSYIPDSIIRLGTIAFDKLEAKSNENYRNKSHQSFYKNGKYQDHAQLGALRIPNIKKMMRDLESAPRLDTQAPYISQPTLVIYGMKDTVLGIPKGMMKKKLTPMYNAIGSKEKRKQLFLEADHSLNYTTKADDHFNNEPELQRVKKEIQDHHKEYLL